jgi:hypothetical protein
VDTLANFVDEERERERNTETPRGRYHPNRYAPYPHNNRRPRGRNNPRGQRGRISSRVRENYGENSYYGENSTRGSNANPNLRGVKGRGKSRGIGRGNGQKQSHYPPKVPQIAKKLNLETFRYIEREENRSIHVTERGRGRSRNWYGRSRGYRGRAPSRGFPSASIGRNPVEEERRYDEHERYESDPQIPPGFHCSCCRYNNLDEVDEHHCPGCLCRELEESKREEERKKRNKDDSQPKSEVHVANKDKRKEKKDNRITVAVVGHSFVEHLKNAIWEKVENTGKSWEEAMLLHRDNVVPRYKGISGADHYSMSRLTNYIQTNNAIYAFLEMGSNDLTGVESPEYIANMVIDKLEAFMSDHPKLRKCLIGMAIPRIKIPESARYDFEQYRDRVHDYNKQIKARTRNNVALECWDHLGLMTPTERLLDDKGIHPEGPGMVYYMDSISRAIKYLANDN